MRLIPVTTLNGITAITQVITTGTLTAGSAVVTGIASTAALVGALGVSGVGILSNTYVQSIDSSSQVTLTQVVSGTGAQSLTFTIEPIMLSEAKQQARIEYPDEDALVAGLITAARLYCETALKQSLMTQQWVLYLDSFPSAGGLYNRAIREIWPSLGSLPSGLGFYPGMLPNSTGVIDIPKSPIKSVDSVQYIDNYGVLQTYAPSSYNISLGSQSRIQPQYSHVWPISRPTIDSVQITFTAGYGATADKIPDNIKAAMKLYVAGWFENREHIAQSGYMVVPATVDMLLSASDMGIYA